MNNVVMDKVKTAKSNFAESQRLEKEGMLETAETMRFNAGDIVHELANTAIDNPFNEKDDHELFLEFKQVKDREFLKNEIIKCTNQIDNNLSYSNDALNPISERIDRFEKATAAIGKLEKLTINYKPVMTIQNKKDFKKINKLSRSFANDIYKKLKKNLTNTDDKSIDKAKLRAKLNLCINSLDKGLSL